jgi:hypothetical protein
MTRISERQSLTREEKFVALVHLYAELRLSLVASLNGPSIAKSYTARSDEEPPPSR